MATNKTMLALRKNYGSSRKTYNIKYIVLHYTANDGDTAQSNAKYFQTAYRGASAHYFVDDNYVIQSVPDNYTAYAVGGSRYSNYKSTGGASLYGAATNVNTINIEMCDMKKDGTYGVSEATLANTVALVKQLMTKYKIDVNHVIRHFDVTGKSCPSYYVDETAWAAFKAMLTETTPATSSNVADYALVFDTSYYAANNTDLGEAGIVSDAALFNHFLNYGMNEARVACATFNVVTYKANYPDLQEAFGDDWPSYYRHYIANGYAEGRTAV